MQYKVLIVGSGGREHALAWKISQSPLLEKLFVAPGNAGTAGIAENVEIAASDIRGLSDFAQKQEIDLVVIGPDDTLSAGLVDILQELGIKSFGPTKSAAQIESSKALAKELMKSAKVPTADYGSFDDFDSAVNFLSGKRYPVYIKASGLALGKGAVRCDSEQEAHKTLKSMLIDLDFGDAGKTVVIEQFMDGPEMSMHAFCDGNTYEVFPSSQDNKTIFEQGRGPNTGGMGVVAPLQTISTEFLQDTAKIVVEPILNEMSKRNMTFTGLLYPGLKLTQEGPKVVEYNARFGDPETQAYMRILDSDLLEILMACAEGKLAQVDVRWKSGFCVCVIMASGGYPGSYEKDKTISGIEDAESELDVVVFHAGTKNAEGGIATNGGRVLAVTAYADTLESARTKAYDAVARINFEGAHYRKDIGLPQG